MRIKKIIDSLNDTNIYIIYDEFTKNSIVIDPSNFTLVDEFAKTRNLYIDYIILTHEHFDHILGVNELIDKYNSILITSISCNLGIMNSKANLSSFSEVLLYYKNMHGEKCNECEWKRVKPYICKSAEIVFENEKLFNWNNHEIFIHETPGHSKGSVSILVDEKILFSGDSLLRDMKAITRFPGGSTKEYNNITIPYYKTLNENLIVYPGHGESFKLKEKLNIEEN